MESPKAPTGWGLGRGNFSRDWAVPLRRKILACSPSKWCVLVHSGARFRANIIATMMFMTSAD